MLRGNDLCVAEKKLLFALCNFAQIVKALPHATSATPPLPRIACSAPFKIPIAGLTNYARSSASGLGAT